MSKTSNMRFPVMTGLDIGSTKVTLMIGIPQADGSIDIVGVGVAPNNGVKQGIVINIESTTEAIRKAREEAELMSGYQVSDVWVGISGSHIKSFDSKGMVAIKNKEVNSADIDRVLEAAQAVAVPSERTVLHVLPREFRVDGQDGISDPVGMSGVRLEASVHIVTGNQMVIQNLAKCIEKANMKIRGLVLDQLASALAVLSDDEKNLGVCVVDMGGGTCNTLYFVNGSVAYTSMIPVGGQNFTHDIAVGLRTPQSCAEEIKKKYGCALASLVGDQDTIEVEGVGGRKTRTVLRRDLAEVIEPRAEETLQLIQMDLQSSQLLNVLGSGVVLTGGASQLDGLIEMGEFIFDVPVRRGYPSKVGGLTDVVKSSCYATAVGLLYFGMRETKNFKDLSESQESVTDSVADMSRRVRDFFGQLF